jgi:ABC-type multidrug transport system ATPase subunit
MIAAHDLTKNYDCKPVLRGLSMSARAGEVTLLVGANGAGKTTTLRILAGLIRPDSGDATVGGVSIVTDRIGAQRQLGFLPQGVAFHPRLTCVQVLRFYARLRGIGDSRVEQMLRMVGLEAEAGKRTAALSGGLRQRLGIAVLLLPDAPVLMLDEPGLSLDPEWRDWLQTMLHQEAQRGRTVLVTTHLLGEWDGVADRCLVCEDGRMAREIDPAHLRLSFGNRFGLPTQNAVA